jgi:guanylate kinase
MTYEELLDKGLIKRIKPSPSQVKDRLKLAKRDIKAAKTMIANDRDWAFSMAYNAVLQATRALPRGSDRRAGRYIKWL